MILPPGSTDSAGSSRTDPVDVHVGKQLRARRKELGMSQDQLAQVFNISFQQVQKYERGANRICASKLYILTQVLKVPVSYFFQDAPAVSVRQEQNHVPDETQQLTDAYYRIRDSQVRRRIVSLARALAHDKPPGRARKANIAF